MSIIAQRLARRICPHCSIAHPDSEALIEKYQLHQLAARCSISRINLRQAQGCEQCANAGYKGRMAVIEYLRSDENIRAIAKDEQFIPKAKIHNAEIGGRNLLEDGLSKAMQGLTTIDEIIRVCG